MVESNSLRPLEGRTILDCSTLLPGPLIGKLCASMGAKILKIENPLKPDGARGMGEFYNDLNACKELHWLNLKDGADQKKFQALLCAADGLVEGFRPRAKRKLGLDADTLQRLNPKLCTVSLVGYREGGPKSERAGHDLNFEALTGALSLFGEMPALPLADLFAAYSGAFALTSLLDAAARTGKGGRIVVSLAEVMLQVQGGFFREFKKTRIEPRPGETLMSGQFPCYRLYRAKDGRRVAVGAIEAKFWSKCCEVLGMKEFSELGYATGAKGNEVTAAVEAAFASKTWAEWAPLFESADCCVEPVLTYGEVDPDDL